MASFIQNHESSQDSRQSHPKASFQLFTFIVIHSKSTILIRLHLPFRYFKCVAKRPFLFLIGYFGISLALSALAIHFGFSTVSTDPQEVGDYLIMDDIHKLCLGIRNSRNSDVR